MTLAIVITALAVFLCGASIGILAVVVAGIRSDDRAQNLTEHSPHPHRGGHPPPARRRHPQPRNLPRHDSGQS